jgi:hypothetical protein
MTFLQNTGAATRSWPMGARDISVDVAGWMEYDCGENDNGRRTGEEYVGRQWGDGVQEDGVAGEAAEGADEGGEAVVVG